MSAFTSLNNNLNIVVAQQEKVLSGSSCATTKQHGGNTSGGTVPSNAILHNNVVINNDSTTGTSTVPTTLGDSATSLIPTPKSGNSPVSSNGSTSPPTNVSGGKTTNTNTSLVEQTVSKVALFDDSNFSQPVENDAAKCSWSETQEAALKDAVENANVKSWMAIAVKVDGRTPEQCAYHWNNVLKNNLTKRPWAKEEDQRLCELVKQFGPKRWSLIANNLNGRIGKQCRERWHNHLNPSVNKTAWTSEEDHTIFEHHKKLGNQWAEIAKMLPGRTDNSIKNRYYSTMRRLMRQRQREASERLTKGYLEEKKLSNIDTTSSDYKEEDHLKELVEKAAAKLEPMPSDHIKVDEAGVGHTLTVLLSKDESTCRMITGKAEKTMIKLAIKLLTEKIKEERELAMERERRIKLGLPLEDGPPSKSNNGRSSNGSQKTKKSPSKKKKKKKKEKNLAGTKRSNTSKDKKNKSRKRSRTKDLRLDPNLVQMVSSPLSLNYQHGRYPGSGASILAGFQFSPDGPMMSMNSMMQRAGPTPGYSKIPVIQATWTGGSMAGGGIPTHPHHRTMLSVARQQQSNSNNQQHWDNTNNARNNSSSSSSSSNLINGNPLTYSTSSLNSLSSLDSEASSKTLPAHLRHQYSALNSVKGMLPFDTPTANGHITTTPLPTDKSTEDMLLDDFMIVGHSIDQHQRDLLAENKQRQLKVGPAGNNNKYIGQEILGMQRLPSDSIMRGCFKGSSRQPTPVGGEFRCLVGSPTFDMWSIHETPAKNASSHMYSPSSMSMHGLEPFSPIREVDSMLMSDN
jgi:hypothetical protein